MTEGSMSSEHGAGNPSVASPLLPPRIDRRSLVLGTALTTLLGAAGTAAPAAAAPLKQQGARPNVILNDGGAKFDLTDPPKPFLKEKRVRDSTVMQSFAFDDVNGVLYVAQVMQSGRRLTGESAPVSGAQRLANGDVCVTRLNYSGQILSWMYLRSFGHSVAIGVEPDGASTYLWLGTASVPNSSGVGYGTQVARVAFTPGAVIDYPSTAIEVHDPVPEGSGVSVSVDMLNRTLLLRCYVGGVHRYSLYNLDAFRGGTYQPFYSCTETGISDVFQGHAHYYDQVYRLEGRSGGVDAAPTHVSRFDLPSGRMTQRTVSKAAPTLTFREPQGLAVQRKPLRLQMGFADGPVGARNISLYYKDRYAR